MYFRDDVPLCPVDGCTQPHAGRVWAAMNEPITKLNIQFGTLRGAGVHAAVDQAVNAAATERGRRVDGILREHLRSHDVLDFVRTIHRLNCELEQYQSGIRPHAPQPGGSDLHQHHITGAHVPADVVALLGRAIEEQRDARGQGRA